MMKSSPSLLLVFVAISVYAAVVVYGRPTETVVFINIGIRPTEVSGTKKVLPERFLSGSDCISDCSKKCKAHWPTDGRKCSTLICRCLQVNKFKLGTSSTSHRISCCHF